ncbi:unnamed protein product [Phaeothamnion confervicola]
MWTAEGPPGERLREVFLTLFVRVADVIKLPRFNHVSQPAAPHCFRCCRFSSISCVFFQCFREPAELVFSPTAVSPRRCSSHKPLGSLWSTLELLPFGKASWPLALLCLPFFACFIY